MKKSINLIAVVALVAVLLGVSAAAVNANVNTTPVTSSAGGSFSVPLIIDGSSGIMGFKMTVEYPDILEMPSVTRGEITADGNLYDSITGQTDGKFEVVWNNTADVKGDGELCILNFNVKEDAANGDYEIKLSFSTADTFNENWDDVVISAAPVKVKIVAAGSAEESTAQTPRGETSEPENKETLEDEFIKEISESASPGDVAAAIEKAAEEAGVKSPVEIPDDKKEAFVKKAEEKLAVLSPYIGNVPQNFSADEKAELIIKVYEEAQTGFGGVEFSNPQVVAEPETGNEEVLVNTDEKNNITAVIVAAAVIIALAFSAVVIYKKTHKNKGKRNEKEI